ncbi:Fip1 motif-domain-containing protein [Lasiosphaeris hirsuta]|uniref:Fip1 motif-domain-containing protein n=1 Tax=Lasiosphaeris hirsuta TaxID=260670 RepID=A0AA40DWT9_9PEZI|nr:Fip1 motif-domain-containing protein [Lasiosphaeris hirsuta]
MDIDEDDDFYAPEEPETAPAQHAQPAPAPVATKTDVGDELEEGEEEDEGGEMDEDEDSDIDIIVERKDNSKPAPPSQSRYSEIRNIPQRSTSNDIPIKSAPFKKEKEESKQSLTEFPPVSMSKVNVNAIPVHQQTGKPLTQINIDEDLADKDKPWRKPGTDLSDYFNYGFDEFTWALYAQKQEALRGEYSQEAVAQTNKKMMEEMTSMMMMGNMMPGMAGGSAAGAGAAAGAAIPGMDGVTPDMQQMMQQMMAGNMDPSQMDPNAMSAMFAGMQNAGGGGGQGGQGQNFGAGFGRGRRW